MSKNKKKYTKPEVKKKVLKITAFAIRNRRSILDDTILLAASYPSP